MDRRISPREQLDAYKKIGFCFIPIPYKLKVAAIQWREFIERKPTEEESKDWFKQGKNSNLAIVCGKVSGQNGTSLVVLDFDEIPNYEAFSRKAEDSLGRKLHELTPVVRTCRGYQVYFYVKEPCQSRQLGTVEVRSDGNYVIAPPSIHPMGRQYEFINPEVTAPYTINSLLDVGIDVSQPKPKSADGTPNWITEALEGVSEGERDNTCTSLAGWFLKTQAPDIVKTILYPFADKCEPPFEHQSVDKTVDSVARKESLKTPVDTRGDTLNGVTSISINKDIGGKFDPDPELTNETLQDSLHLRDDFDPEKLVYGGMSDAYHKFMSENPEPHYKQEVKEELRELLGAGYSDNSFRQVFNRARAEGKTKVRYGGKIQFANTDWKASRVKFTEEDALVSLGLKLPFDMDFYIDILKKSSMTVEGEISSGKTHFQLEFASLNLGKMPMRFFFAELGTPRMLDLLRDYPNLLEAVKCQSDDFILINTDINDLDVLESLDSNGINLYDYLRPEGGEQWWLNMQLKLREYAKRLEDGFLMVNLQKLKGRSNSLGGEGNRFQCETSITLNAREEVQGLGDGEAGYKLCRLDIEKARDWRQGSNINPVSMAVDYRTGGLRGRLYMIEHSWDLKTTKQKRDKQDREGKL